MYRVVLTFESVDELLKCYHSNKSYWAVLSCGTVYYAVQGGSNFWVCGWNPEVDHSNKSSWTSLFCGSFYYVRCTSWLWWKSQSVAIQMKAILRRTFLWYLLVGLSFEPGDKTLNFDHSSEISWTILSYGVHIYYAVKGNLFVPFGFHFLYLEISIRIVFTIKLLVCWCNI